MIEERLKGWWILKVKLAPVVRDFLEDIIRIGSDDPILGFDKGKGVRDPIADPLELV